MSIYVFDRPLMSDSSNEKSKIRIELNIIHLFESRKISTVHNHPSFCVHLYQESCKIRTEHNDNHAPACFCTHLYKEFCKINNIIMDLSFSVVHICTKILDHIE